MPKFQIIKTIQIHKKADAVFKYINDFHFWPKWSPWLIVEPQTHVEVQQDGKYFSWEGKITGSGAMRIEEEQENKALLCDLQFFKPWKSKAKTTFHLTEDKGTTEVTWKMDSQLPFFLFWMKKSMEIFIGMDYERGLKLLKNLCEDGKVHSQLEFRNLESLPEMPYIGIETPCRLCELGPKMATDFGTLMAYIEENYADLKAGDSFTIYHDFNPVKDHARYTAAFPVHRLPESLEPPFISGVIPELKAHVVRHRGPYEHLGNAWSAQLMYQRAKVFKLNKKIPAFEIYRNSPLDTAPNDLITDIFFAVK